MPSSSSPAAPPVAVLSTLYHSIAHLRSVAHLQRQALASSPSSSSPQQQRCGTKRPSASDCFDVDSPHHPAFAFRKAALPLHHHHRSRLAPSPIPAPPVSRHPVSSSIIYRRAVAAASSTANRPPSAATTTTVIDELESSKPPSEAGTSFSQTGGGWDRGEGREAGGRANKQCQLRPTQ